MTSDRWPEIDRLYHAALGRPTAERAAFLDDACAGDQALRRELESLLGFESAAEGFLEHSALEHATQQLSSDALLPPPDPRVPGYTILRTLGEGGMGVVYLAEQLTPIRRQVALKLIKHGMDTRQVVARFEAERQALALMQHPGIAAVYDAGTTAEGRPYFVMEYVDGEPVTEYRDRRRLSTRSRLDLFTDICAAVQHAHQKGVIHRDLKPSNALVSDQDGRAQPKIIDFGVAKAIGRSLSAGTAFTELGAMVGTPEYMSPEQAALSDDIDTTTDVYSLGVLLYELLVGALPFDPQMLRAVGYDEMRRVIRESDPPRPSSRLTGAATAGTAAIARQTDAGRLTRELKGDLDWITLKALEKDRRQRYQTVAAFAGDIAHYLANEPILASRPSALYRVRKFTRRYRGAVMAVAAVFLALVAGLGASLTQYARAERQRVEADLQRAQADRQRTIAEESARDAATQSNAAVLATDDANRQRLAATTEATVARAAIREVEARDYGLTIAAADGELRSNFAPAARERLLAVPAALRQWEWQHLFLRTDASLVTLTSVVPCPRPGDDIDRPAVVSDRVLVPGDGGARLYLRRCDALEVWDGSAYRHVTHRAPGKILAVGPTGEVLAVSPSPSAAAAQWRLVLIDPATNRELHGYGPFSAEPICADISGDGTRLAVGFMPEFKANGEPMDDLFDIWDLREARRLVRLAPQKPPLFDTRFRPAMSCMLAFSPGSAYLASSGATVNIWRSDTGADVTDDAIQAGTVAQPIAWSADGARLAIGRLTGHVDLLALVALKLDHLDGSRFIQVMPLPDGDRRLLVAARKRNEVLSLAFSRDGNWLMSGADTGVGVWSISQKRLTQILAGHAAQVNGVATDAAGHIVSADSTGHVKVWPAPSAAVASMTVLPGANKSGTGLVVSADGSVVGLAQSDGGLFAWRLADLHQRVFRAGSGKFDLLTLARSLAISPDGAHLFAAEFDAVGTVRSWEMESGGSTAMALNANPAPGCENVWPESPTNAVGRMAVSPDGRSLAFQQGRCLRVQDLSTMTVVATFHAFAGSFAFRPDGLLLISTYAWVPVPTAGPGHADIVLWDWRNDRVRVQVPAPQTRTNPTWQVSMSANGHVIAIVQSQPAIVSIWDGDLQRELGRVPVPPDTERVALSADGHRLASAGGDSVVRIWDVDRLRLLLILTDDDDRHSGGLAFTPEGRLIAGRSSGGLVIWETSQRPPGSNR